MLNNKILQQASHSN